jgi:hypothetical protein
MEPIDIKAYLVGVIARQQTLVKEYKNSSYNAGYSYGWINCAKDIIEKLP